MAVVGAVVRFHDDPPGGVPIVNCTAGGEIEPTEARLELEPARRGGTGTAAEQPVLGECAMAPGDGERPGLAPGDML